MSLKTEKTLSHDKQAKDFSPVCLLIWFTKQEDVEKVLSHRVQEYCFSPLCAFIWSVRFPWTEKVLSHWGHEYGFSPEWTLLCLFRLLDWLKDLSQEEQVKGLSPVCVHW